MIKPRVFCSGLVVRLAAAAALLAVFIAVPAGPASAHDRGRECRTYTEEFWNGWVRRTAEGVACRNHRGEWEVVTRTGPKNYDSNVQIRLGSLVIDFRESAPRTIVTGSRVVHHHYNTPPTRYVVREVPVYYRSGPQYHSHHPKYYKKQDHRGHRRDRDDDRRSHLDRVRGGYYGR